MGRRLAQKVVSPLCPLFMLLSLCGLAGSGWSLWKSFVLMCFHPIWPSLSLFSVCNMCVRVCVKLPWGHGVNMLTPLSRPC